MENKRSSRARELFLKRQSQLRDRIIEGPSKASAKYHCVHGKIKYYCRDCGGSQICEHYKRRARCILCGGGSLCEHERIRYFCKVCKGKGICEHDRQKYHCKECGKKKEKLKEIADLIEKEDCRVTVRFNE